MNQLANIRNLFHVARPKQWIKQTLILLPALLMIDKLSRTNILYLLLAIIIFTLTSIGIYIFNDLSDLEEDRIISARKTRPIASGKFKISTARKLVPVFLFTPIILSLMLPNSYKSTSLLLFYVMINLIYSQFKVKNHSTIGILIVGLGFPIRFGLGISVLNLKDSFWGYVLILELALVLLAGKRFQSYKRSVIHNSEVCKDTDQDFWLLALVIFSALFISTYCAFISQAQVQQTWGLETLLISTIPVGLGLVRYMELATHPEKLILEDVTESFVKDKTLFIIGFLYIFIMFMGLWVNK